MNRTPRAAELIECLLADPGRFYDEGKSYDLLQEFFQGFPVMALRPLLSHPELVVRRVAVWLAAELGTQASVIISHVVPLLFETDRYVRYHALEAVMVCSHGENAGKFIHVVDAMTDKDPVIRRLAMRLVFRATDAQLKAAIEACAGSKSSAKLHEHGLKHLLQASVNSREDVLSMLNSPKPVIRKYGALLAKRIAASGDSTDIFEAKREDDEVRQFLVNGG